jgi:hypothetical protein
MLLPAMFIIPMQTPEGWQKLEYKNIPSHSVTWDKSGMNVQVKQSASPLIYAFPDSKKIKSISVTGTIEGRLQFPEGKIQGEKGADDFELRVGLIIPGSRVMSWWEKKIAPAWLVTLQSLAPAGMGIEKVIFLNQTRQELNWKTRLHPLSKYFEEHNLGMIAENQKNIELKYTFAETVAVNGLWLAIDGDDLKQSFKIVIKEILLE